MTDLQVAAFVVVLNERLVEVFIARWFDKYKWDKDLLQVASWVIGCGLSLLCNLNLLGDVVPHPVVGWVLTAIIIGGGSNLLHDVFSTVRATKVYMRNNEK